MNMVNILSYSWIPVGVSELEQNAETVVRSNKNYSVIAGPGAGKTELLAQRACYLLQTGQCPNPYRILAISFKKDAANNLKERVAERCSKEEALRFDSLTFDAFAKSMLDRFMGALPEVWRPTTDYELYFPKKHEYESFLRSLSLNFSDDSVRKLEKIWILGSPLSTEKIQEIPTEFLSIAAKRWWEACLHMGGNSRLTFPMIERLVELLLRTNPKICNALKATYTHVFMDEFQDTTHVQYDLVKTAFLNSQTVLTAVGDNKQQIMRWAMALDDAFSVFEKDFKAERIQLFSNYRSSSELVEIQHKIALTIDQNYKQVESKISKNISEEPCVIWDFKTPEVEAEHLAKTISSTISSYRLTPRDFVIIVKQKADSYEPSLKKAFQRNGLKIRVQQDILAEPLTEFFLAFLRFASRERAGVYWSDCYKILGSLRGINPTDDKSSRLLQEELNNFHRHLQYKMNHVSFQNKQINELLKEIEKFVVKESIQAYLPEYKQSNRYEDLFKKISNKLQKSCETVEHKSWESILDDFEGKDSVSIMTIHKSKGLQYHTVIFVGLDDSAWWSFPNQPEESRASFFVAFSRAKQRVIFTYCEQRGQRSNKVSSLYEVLHRAGVKTEVIESQVIFPSNSVGEGEVLEWFDLLFDKKSANSKLSIMRSHFSQRSAKCDRTFDKYLPTEHLQLS
ncbi:ATP-dependent helicase [Brasilonema sp. CT11]|nr:ATP-dependent helicase [Brasilonema sp. CT11]